jgi:hypothetical protein
MRIQGTDDAPIGALVSSDGGKTFKDLGIVFLPVMSQLRENCSSLEATEISVILDGTGEYFIFTNMVAPSRFAMARMAGTGTPAGAVQVSPGD